MTSYNAIGEVDVSPTPRRADQWIDRLTGYSPAVNRSERGKAEIVITLEAPYLDVAAATALQLLTRATGQLLSFTVMSTEEFDRRVDAIEVEGPTIGTREAAALLGVSRQRMQQLHADRVLPAKLVGRTLVWPRSAVEAYAAGHGARFAQ